MKTIYELDETEIRAAIRYYLSHARNKKEVSSNTSVGLSGDVERGFTASVTVDHDQKKSLSELDDRR